MSAIINNSYLDFFTIAVDAYQIENKSIYRKLMMTIISTYKVLTNEMELSYSSLENCDTLLFSEKELEDFYEEVYNAIDIIKLYKIQLNALKSEEKLFSDLYEVVDKLHLVVVDYLDRVSTLEAKKIQQIDTKVA